MFWQLPHHKAQDIVWLHEGIATTAEALSAQLAPMEAALLALPRKSCGLIACRNHPAAIAMYLATLRSGHAAMLLSADMPAPLWEKMLAAYCPDWIFHHLPDTIDGYAPQDTWLGWRWHVRGDSGGDSGYDIHPGLALLLATSGSTGSPQMVRLSYTNLADNAAAIAASLALEPGDRAITSLPVNYSYGLSVVNSLLQAGGSLAITGASLVQPEFWQMMQQGVTHLAGVPSQYQMLSRLRFEQRAPASLRILTQAGGRLAAEEVSHFASLAEKQGWRFHVMYGQTEATARIACLPAGKAAIAPDSVGLPLPGGELHADPETGELIYKGRNVMMGYAENTMDLRLGDTCHGILHTGDLGTCGQDGFWRITGRLKRFLKLSGLRINLQEIEDDIRQFAPCACGGDDSRLILWVAAKEDAGLATRLSDRLFARFGIHPSLSRIIFIEAIPLTANGKTDYQRLQEYVS